MDEIKLTAYSHSSGCGCKIAPDVLEKILADSGEMLKDKNLLVGYNTKDDAAVYDLGNGTALISTVDFFMPIVDDAFDFGRIAAANAISDVYAMGGKPLLATAILGWPVNTLPAELAREVIKGAREVCHSVNITISGGHSIDSPEPFFGLSVNGLVQTSHLKRNATCQEGDLIYLTKALGSGILATALKRGMIADQHKHTLIDALTTVNTIGEKMGGLSYVNAMTDITGFGLLGHLIEMMDAANLSAELDYQNVQLLEGVTDYSSKMIVPDNLYRNWNSFKDKVQNIGHESFLTLSDPQTNGGLMVAVSQEHKHDFEMFLRENQMDQFAKPIVKIIKPTTHKVVLV